MCGRDRIGRRLIRLDEKLVDIFPESVPEDPGSNLPKVSLEHLLTMTSGLENSLFFCDWEERYTTQQAVDSVCCFELRKNKYEEEGYEQGLFIGIITNAL